MSKSKLTVISAKIPEEVYKEFVLRVSEGKEAVLFETLYLRNCRTFLVPTEFLSWKVESTNLKLRWLM